MQQLENLRDAEIANTKTIMQLLYKRLHNN